MDGSSGSETTSAADSVFGAEGESTPGVARASKEVETTGRHNYVSADCWACFPEGRAGLISRVIDPRRAKVNLEKARGRLEFLVAHGSAAAVELEQFDFARHRIMRVLTCQRGLERAGKGLQPDMSDVDVAEGPVEATPFCSGSSSMDCLRGVAYLAFGVNPWRRMRVQRIHEKLAGVVDDSRAVVAGAVDAIVDAVEQCGAAAQQVGQQEKFQGRRASAGRGGPSAIHPPYVGGSAQQEDTKFFPEPPYVDARSVDTEAALYVPAAGGFF